MSVENLHVVNQAVPKKDALAIMGGAPVYTEDLVPADALTVRILRSPHAFARIRSIDKTIALKVPGVVCVLTYEDVPHHRHSYAGSNYPGNNPFDRCILEDIVRYVGDPVAIIAAETAAAADKALRLVKVDYEVLEPVLDYECAEGHPSVVHPEDDYVFQMEVGGDLSRNILMTEKDEAGDFEAVYAACPVQLDETYYTSANQQAMMETFRTFSYYDHAGLLTVVGSTQIPFHARRIVAQALGLPHSKVRVIKPRIGGGFGAKQSLTSEIFPAVVTMVTGRPAYCCFSRRETFSCGNTRHPFRVRVRLGATEDGIVQALWVDSLENVGAYGEHAVNVPGLSGHKTIPLYGKAKAWRYTGRAVYTNMTPGGAFRGYGATQGCFAVESTVNKMAMRLNLDPTEVRLKNLPEVGKPMPAYYNEPLNSCSLDRCIARGKEMIGWEEKYVNKPFARQVGPHRYRGLGMAITMQGSGLSNLDSCSVRIRLDDNEFYTLAIGASDMGTGCDTILAQMAAEVLKCDVDQIVTSGVDTLYSPFDKGSYASSTTYVTGNATVLAAKALLEKMRGNAAQKLGVPAETLDFDGKQFTDGTHTLTVKELGMESVNGHSEWMSAGASYCSPVSPPPFVAGFAEVEVDTETGEVKVCDLVGVVDCGTAVNKALARVQTEGGFAQGVGMALYEQVTMSDKGQLYTDNFMQYNIPSRLDVPEIRIEFEESYEPTGPFGAKSIGEVVINTPTPAILSAIRNAVGVEIHSLPASAEKVFAALQEADENR